MRFELVDDEKIGMLGRVGGGMRTLGGGLLRFPFKNPYTVAAGGLLYGAGDYLASNPSVQNFAADIPFYYQENPITGKNQFSTYDEMRDIENIPADELEMNQFLSEYYPEVFDVLESQEDRQVFYDSAIEDIQNVVKPPVETPTPPVETTTPSAGLFGDDVRTLLMIGQAAGLFGDKKPATQIVKAQATPGLQLDAENPYDKLRRGIFG